MYLCSISTRLEQLCSTVVSTYRSWLRLHLLVDLTIQVNSVPAVHSWHCSPLWHPTQRADAAVQWPPRAPWIDGLFGPVWLETGVCHRRMKAWLINIIGEHLLLVTTQGAMEHLGASISSTRDWVCMWGGGAPTSAGGPIHPSLTPGTGCREHAWSRHLPASAGPQISSEDRRENAPVHLKNNSRITFSLSLWHPHLQRNEHIHTPCTTGARCSSAFHSPTGVTLTLDPSLVDERRLVVA